MLYDYQKQLEEARKREKAQKREARKTIKKYNTGRNKGLAKDTIHQAKDAAKSLAPWRFLSLLFSQGSLSDWMYFLAIFAAIFKDILDFTGLGSLPLIGTVITLCISIFIGFMMLLGGFSAGSGRKQYKQQKIIRSFMILAGGTIIEATLFGVNFLPIETITALLIYSMLLVERKRAQEEEEEQKTALQIEEVYA